MGVMGVYYIWHLAPSLKRHLTENTDSTDDSNLKTPHSKEDDEFVSRTDSSMQLIDRNELRNKISITATPIESRPSGFTYASEGLVHSEWSQVEDPIIARWRAEHVQY